jgi:predicted RNA-binding protein with PUA-like domain
MAKQYWLFKAEPDVYGIDHLAAAPNQTGRWDGIRNYQARNFLRDHVQLNDDVFIYHSSCKNVGIVGTAKVVKTAYPDPTQFDPESDYYDPKSSPENPRWISVDIQLTKIFPRLISLTEIKAQPALENMVLVRQGRLSTQPVTSDEWKYINGMLK